MTAVPSPLGGAAVWPPKPVRLWGPDQGDYDRDHNVRADELRALCALGWRELRRTRNYRDDASEWAVIARLLRPLDDVYAVLHYPDIYPADRDHQRACKDAIATILLRSAETERTYWAWSPADWSDLIGASVADFRNPWPVSLGKTSRQYVAAFAYLIGEVIDFDDVSFKRLPLLTRVFGDQAVDATLDTVVDVLQQWGYRGAGSAGERIRTVLRMVLLFNRSSRLEDLTTEVFDRVRRDGRLMTWQRNTLFGIQRAVAHLGFCAPPTPQTMPKQEITGTSPAWADVVARWHDTSPLTPKVRRSMRGQLAKAGRWLQAEHPEITEPGEWTRQTCAAWVAVVDRMDVGAFVQRAVRVGDREGKPLSPRAKASLLSTLRTFFRDCQEWEWISRRFDPMRALATPQSLAALIGPDPRVIADDIWAKLLWAGLNLEQGDLPATAGIYPIELVRAFTLTWLFAGQRSDEIARLRVGCVRWQHDGAPIPGDSEDVLVQDAVCLLDIPTHKTGTAFTKPVDPLLGKAVEAWEAVRPHQPKITDRKTGEQVDLLFAYRGYRVANDYINKTIIPALCRKAGVPTSDVRGNITSHRARSTIATQLYNAKEPMTLFELQAWLGHRSPHSTQHYAKITPNTLARAYNDAGYFARNVRTIEVLVDRDAVTSGAAAAGEPWQYYDLGHGFCTYTFFEQCPHRMACARCDFYTPKDSSRGQLLEAKDNLQRMLANLPLTDDEQAAVDDGQAALDALLERLTDVPTPDGTTPREIGIPATATLLPIIAVNQGKQE